jgi:hypothetical protein
VAPRVYKQTETAVLSYNRVASVRHQRWRTGDGVNITRPFQRRQTRHRLREFTMNLFISTLFVNPVSAVQIQHLQFRTEHGPRGSCARTPRPKM